MKGMRKQLAMAVMALGLMVLCAVPTMAAKTMTNYKEIKAGQNYYVYDKNISGNGIISNYFKVEVQGSANYDLVFSMGTAAEPSVGSLIGYTKNYTSKATNAYVKASASANTGYFVGIRVRSGSVILRLYSTTEDGSFKISLANAKTASVLKTRTLAKGRQIAFQMGAGNVSRIPLIFGGTKGSRIQRKISSTKYEIYVFGNSYIKRGVYTSNKLTATSTIKYQSTYKLSGKTYKCAFVPIPKNSNNSSGTLKNVKGSVAFFYPRQSLSIAYKIK